uniref:Proteasome assembly chaperone 1 n=1 Tax=Timema tahoe TaxID=61484 RepID=A0A7R9FDZ3_9NEOP|nr:unnamed protein product [Timema tahoe]
MSTFFGEIVQRPSRAFWDEEDESSDDDSNLNKPLGSNELTMKWKNEENQKTYSAELFLLVNGYVAEEYVKRVILNKDAVANIYETQPKEKSNRTSQSKLDAEVAQLYFLDSNISPFMREAKHVIIMTSHSVGSHFHEDRSELPLSFLKQLQTDNYLGAKLYGHLEQPNTVTGVPAQALSWCQVFKVPAVAYILYTDCEQVDSITTEPLRQLVSKLPVKLPQKSLLPAVAQEQGEHFTTARAFKRSGAYHPRTFQKARAYRPRALKRAIAYCSWVLKRIRAYQSLTSKGRQELKVQGTSREQDPTRAY